MTATRSTASSSSSWTGWRPTRRATFQRIALDLAEVRGVSPDRFRYEEDPAREKAIESLGF